VCLGGDESFAAKELCTSLEHLRNAYRHSPYWYIFSLLLAHSNARKRRTLNGHNDGTFFDALTALPPLVKINFTRCDRNTHKDYNTSTNIAMAPTAASIAKTEAL